MTMSSKASDEKGKFKGLLRFILIWWLVSFVIAVLVYKPLPEGFTKRPLDRIVMHCIEGALRVAYYWPSRLFCSDITGMVWWTRIVLTKLSVFVSPILDSDNQLDMEMTQWNNVSVRLYQPKFNASTDGAVVFLHGGGFALGSVAIYESLTRRMAKMLNTLVVSVEYRLSPETPFPGGINDCEAAIDYLIENAHMYGVDPKKIVLMGDSAGGNLVAVITQRRREAAAKPEILGQVLIYPLLQLSDMQSLSYRFFTKHLTGYALVDPESVAFYYMMYAGIDMVANAHLVKSVLTNGHIAPENREKVDRILAYDEFSNMNFDNDSLPSRAVIKYSLDAQRLMRPFLTNPDYSPIMREDLSRLPRALVVTCEFDVLRDEGIMYAKRLQHAGVPTVLRNYKNGFHAMLNFHGEVEEASQAVKDIIDWVKMTLDEASHIIF